MPLLKGVYRSQPTSSDRFLNTSARYLHKALISATISEFTPIIGRETLDHSVIGKLTSAVPERRTILSTGDNKPGLRDIRSLRERLGMLNKGGEGEQPAKADAPQPSDRRIKRNTANRTERSPTCVTSTCCAG